MNWSKKTTRQFIIIFLLFGFGSTYLILDYCSIPKESELMWEGEFKRDVDVSFGNPERAWEINLGNGFISNIEMIFIHLSLIFGCYEMLDFVMDFQVKKEIDLKESFKNFVGSKKKEYVEWRQR